MLWSLMPNGNYGRPSLDDEFNTRKHLLFNKLLYFVIRSILIILTHSMCEAG